MPIIRVEFDDKVVGKKEALALSKAVQKIVSNATKIEDVPVYANSPQINVKIWPIELFIQMSSDKIVDEKALVGEIKSKLSAWKKKNAFPHVINLTFIPMQWKIELGI